MPPPLTPALFLDRDGVINSEVGYLIREEDVRFVAGIFQLCRTAMELGYRLVIVTNQAGIARGFYSEADFQSLMHWVREQFRREGISFDAVYHCPYHPEHGIGEYKREHEDRKPGAGMIRRAAGDLNLDLASSILVGDRCSDIAAANAGGLRRAFLLRGTETGSPACPGPHAEIDSLKEVEDWLRGAGKAPK